MIGTIICCANNKGGIGKTSVTCHLAVALSLLKFKVLVIDNDAQCNATSILLPKNCMVYNTLYEVFDSQAEDVSVESCIYATEYKGLECMPNVEQTSGLELDLAAHHPASFLLLRKKIRAYAKEHYDFTIIDCPPTTGLFVANALFASDYTLIPVDAGSAHSLDGLKKVLDLVASIQVAGNPDLRFLRLLINRVDMRTSITRIILEDIEKRFSKDQIFETRIPVSTNFEQAEYAKETVFSRYPHCRGGRVYNELAHELIDILEK